MTQKTNKQKDCFGYSESCGIFTCMLLFGGLKECLWNFDSNYIESVICGSVDILKN